MDLTDIKQIEEHFDNRYVLKDDCTDRQEKVESRIEDSEKNIAILVTKMNTLIKILSAISVPVLAIAIKMLFGG